MERKLSSSLPRLTPRTVRYVTVKTLSGALEASLKSQAKAAQIKGSLSAKLKVGIANPVYDA